MSHTLGLGLPSLSEASWNRAAMVVFSSWENTREEGEGEEEGEEEEEGGGEDVVAVLREVVVLLPAILGVGLEVGSMSSAVFGLQILIWIR